MRSQILVTVSARSARQKIAIATIGHSFGSLRSPENCDPETLNPKPSQILVTVSARSARQKIAIANIGNRFGLLRSPENCDRNYW